MYRPTSSIISSVLALSLSSAFSFGPPSPPPTRGTGRRIGHSQKSRRRLLRRVRSGRNPRSL